MVRSIGPIGKKAGLYARVPASWPAAQGPQPVPAQPPQAGPRRQQALQQTCQWPSQPLWALPGQRRLSPRREPPWRPPWICWCRLSLPGLLAVRAGPGLILGQGRMTSLPGSRTCSMPQGCHAGSLRRNERLMAHQPLGPVLVRRIAAWRHRMRRPTRPPGHHPRTKAAPSTARYAPRAGMTRCQLLQEALNRFLSGRDCIDLHRRQRKRCRYNTNPSDIPWAAPGPGPCAQPANRRHDPMRLKPGFAPAPAGRCPWASRCR